MQKEKIIPLFRLIGITDLKEGESWISGSCPFREYTHENGTDNNPSFGISIGEHSGYHCFSCNKKGKLKNLATSLFLVTGHMNNELRNYIFKEESLGLSSTIENVFTKEKHEESKIRITEEEYDRSFTPFLGNFRGITECTIRNKNLRYDGNRSRFLIPIRRRGDNGIVGIKGRATFDSSLKYLLYTEGGFKDPKTYGIWFGEEEESNKDKSLIIVEGEIDQILLKQEIPQANVWGCMGVGISKRQIEVLKEASKDYPKGIVLFLDNDKAGQNLTQKLIKELSDLPTPIYTINNYHDCKDPGEIINKDKLAEVIMSGVTKCN